MLILRRNVGERLVAITGSGEVISITLCRGQRNSMIGIDAPEGVKILRGELYDAAQRAKPKGGES